MFFSHDYIENTPNFNHGIGKTTPNFDHGGQMKRFIEKDLEAWKSVRFRKSLILRGARQVGKTYVVRKFAKQFSSFVEINLESQPEYREIFDKDLDAKRIIRDISIKRDEKIVPGETLLFIDEIQANPSAVTALRYFYEDIPELHVIAAGSLLDFAIQKVGIPVGRVESLYLYPMSFLEFLSATRGRIIIDKVIFNLPKEPVSEVINKNIIKTLGEYLAIGGMPDVVKCWIEGKDPLRCFVAQHAIIDTYRQDFSKYADRFQIKYVDSVFNSIPIQLGHKFKYSEIEGDYRKRELSPALDLLITAGVAHKVFHSPGQGIPVGAGVDPKCYKVIFLDVALAQAILGLDLGSWFLNPMQQFVNKGEIVEAFVGQELLSYDNPHVKKHLHYWQRNVPGSTAEVDYLIQKGEEIIPIEVKGGAGTTLKSMRMFLDTHKKTPHGIRFSTQNYSVHDKIHSIPLYAVASIFNRDRFL